MSSLRDSLSESLVMDLGPLPAPRLASNVTVHQALPFLVRGRRGAVVVVDGMRPVGIFTERDVLYRLPDGLFTSPADRSRTPLLDVMSKPPITIGRKDTLTDAIGKMVARGCRHLVVVDKNRDLQGLLTTNDLVQYLTDHFPEETLNLPPRLQRSFQNQGGA